MPPVALRGSVTSSARGIAALLPVPSAAVNATEKRPAALPGPGLALTGFT